jgi:RNA polymerase sigma-70 factor (family 1)
MNVSYNTLSDHELTDLLRMGDDGAFTAIYERYWELLYRSAVNILHDPEAAQDIVQNIFISLWLRRDDVQISILKSYLTQATRFGVFKAIRNRQTDRQFYDRLAQTTSDIVSTMPLLFKEEQTLLHELINSLPEKYRETFRLSREDNLTYKQIARLLGISEKAVEKRMSKSLQFIRNGLLTAVCIAACFIEKK